MELSIKGAAEMLKTLDNVSVFVHRNPDGDCLGSGYALCLILRRLGKRAQVISSDKMSEKFAEYFSKHDNPLFDAESFISVDVAAADLLGNNADMAEKMLLCIDHHPSNTGYAQNRIVDSLAAATAEIIYLLAKELNVPMDKDIATAIYIGILTDSGCFRFSCTAPRTHRIAAELMEYVTDFAEINRRFFAVKSKNRIAIEQSALSKLHYYEDGKIAVMPITVKMREESDAADDELDGVASIPCEIEGVEIGVTLREKEENVWRVSLRTASYANASAICAVFNGGGHLRAAGCTVYGSYEEAEEKIVNACKKELNV